MTNNTRQYILPGKKLSLKKEAFEITNSLFCILKYVGFNIKISKHFYKHFYLLHFRLLVRNNKLYLMLFSM